MSRSTRSSSTWVLAGRVLLLGLAAAAVVIAFVATRRDDTPASRAAHVTTYACAMHPQATSSAPGECPICRMALEPLRTAAASGEPRPADADGRADGAPFRSSYDVMWARPRPAPREMRAPAWIDGDGIIVAVFYNDEIATLDAGERGAFAPTRDPGAAWTARLTDDPPTSWDRATSAVRLRVDGTRAPPPGTVGWVKLDTRTRKTLVVPDSALLQSSAGPYVLTLSTDRRVASKRPVGIGRTLYGFASIVSGLRDGERVAVMDTFFVDAERRIGARADTDRSPPAAAGP